MKRTQDAIDEQAADEQERSPAQRRQPKPAAKPKRWEVGSGETPPFFGGRVY
jgi:hypothetical protein